MKTAEKRFYDVQNNYQQLKRWCNNIDMDIDEEIMSEEDEENVFDEDEAEFKKSLEVMYDLAFYLTEQRERLKMIRQRAEAGADVPVKV